MSDVITLVFDHDAQETFITPIDGAAMEVIPGKPFPINVEAGKRLLGPAGNRDMKLVAPSKRDGLNALDDLGFTVQTIPALWSDAGWQVDEVQAVALRERKIFVIKPTPAPKPAEPAEGQEAPAVLATPEKRKR